MSFIRFPYTNAHQLNLDWIINAVKSIFSTAVFTVNGQHPVNGNVDVTATAGVNSVNGQTGDVNLIASDVGALPSTTPIPSASSATPADLGTAAAGSSSSFARGDHVHKMPSASDVGALPSTTPIPTASSSTPADLGTAAAGSSSSFARGDHVHKMPSASDIGALPSSTPIPTASTATPADLGTAAAGSSSSFARGDHVHKMPSASDIGALPSSTPIPTASTATPADLGTAAAGSSSNFARGDHVHKMPSASDVGATTVTASNVAQDSSIYSGDPYARVEKSLRTVHVTGNFQLAVDKNGDQDVLITGLPHPLINTFVMLMRADSNDYTMKVLRCLLTTSGTIQKHYTGNLQTGDGLAVDIMYFEDV